MASEFDLGRGLGSAFNALRNGAAVQQNAYASALRQRLASELLQGKVGDQQAADAAWQAMPQDLENMGVPKGQGQAYTDVTRATGSNANQLGDMFRRFMQAGYLKGAQDALNRGDTLSANFGLSAGGARPLDMTKIGDGTAYNPNVTPEALSQQFRTTPSARAGAATRAPKTFVGADGVLRIIHPDGSAEAVRDRNGQPVHGSDVAAASTVYGRIYSESLDKPTFSDWYNKTWPQIKGTQAPITPAATPAAAGEVSARKTVTKALETAPMDPAARKLGTVYQTPKGPLKWVGKGWLRPQ